LARRETFAAHFNTKSCSDHQSIAELIQWIRVWNERTFHDVLERLDKGQYLENGKVS
jgi:hypothetical protein